MPHMARGLARSVSPSMAMRGWQSCVVLLAAFLALVAGEGFESSGRNGPFRARDGSESYSDHLVHPARSSNDRHSFVPRQLGLPAHLNNAVFETQQAVAPALPVPSAGGSSEDVRRIPAADAQGQAVMERSGTAGRILDLPSASADGAKRRHIMGSELAGRPRRRARRMRHRMGHQGQDSSLHLEYKDRLGNSEDFANLGPRRRPEAARSEQYSRHRSRRRSGIRMENLASLKVEYARAYITAEEPKAGSGPVELLCTVGFKEYATVIWTINGHPLENFIDRSTTTVVKKEVQVKVSKIVVEQLERLPSENGKFVFECTALVDAQVTKATLALGSNIDDSCTSNADCESRGASCYEKRCVCKPSQPVGLKSKHLTCRAASNLGWPCNYNEQCAYEQPNALCTDRLFCDCNLGFIRSLDGKSCDRLVSSPNILGSSCKAMADCHPVGAVCAAGMCACGKDSLEKGGICLPLGHLKLSAREHGYYASTDSMTNMTGSMGSSASTGSAKPLMPSTMMMHDTTGMMMATTGGVSARTVEMNLLVWSAVLVLFRS